MRRTTLFLLGVLLGVALSIGTFCIRDSVRAYDDLRDRVDHIEGFLGALTHSQQ